MKPIFEYNDATTLSNRVDKLVKDLEDISKRLDKLESDSDE